MEKQKVGRPRIFNSPEELWKAFEEYKADLEKQSKEWQKYQYVGKEGRRVEDGQKVPMTREGFYRYCYNNYGSVENYFRDDKGTYEEFYGVCTRMIDEIRENQIIGGLLGFYNPSITQRLNNLKEKSESDIKVTEVKFEFDRLKPREESDGGQ